MTPEALVTGYRDLIGRTWDEVHAGFAPAVSPVPGAVPVPPTSPNGVAGWYNYTDPLSDPVNPPRGDVTIPQLQPDPNRKPGGRPATIPNSSPAIKLAYMRENESAQLLAQAGFADVIQQPGTRPDTGKDPDYTIQGRYFDCIAPNTSSARNVASRIQQKVDSGQADRIILNVSDMSAKPEEMVEQLRKYPIPGLKEVIVVSSDSRYPPARLLPSHELAQVVPAPPTQAPAPPQPPAPTPTVPTPGPYPPPPTQAAPPGPVPVPEDETLGDV